MNIFATDMCPVQSALNLDDKRIIKMILESCQMLSTVAWRYGFHTEGMLKPSFKHHPCTLWVGRTRSNYAWLVDHALAMCVVYKSVYGKIHTYQNLIEKFACLAHKVPKGDLEEFANATEYKGPMFSHMSIIDKYRAFMNLKWNLRDTKKPTWNKRQKPPFLEIVQ